MFKESISKEELTDLPLRWFEGEIILVDDRSTDNTAELITNTCKEDARYHGILLSRNYGHQIALSAGLQHLNATEAIFVIDGDFVALVNVGFQVDGGWLVPIFNQNVVAGAGLLTDPDRRLVDAGHCAGDG